MALGITATVALALGAGFQTSSPPDHVEEDWQLVLGTPDTNLNCPQVYTTMSPTGANTDPSMQFKLNYRDQPSYQAGGLTAQLWQGSNFVSNSDQGSAQFSTSNETITWTQKMSLSGGTINFSVMSGNSTTWGQFGGGDNLTLNTSSSLSDLSGYKPDYSVAKSAAPFGPNLVTTMTLVQVRYYQGNTLLSTDTTPRQVNVAP
jgi:hypothetical protein